MDKATNPHRSQPFIYRDWIWNFNTYFKTLWDQHIAMTVSEYCWGTCKLFGVSKFLAFSMRKTNFGPKMFFSCSRLLLYRSYVLLCKRGITQSRYYLLKVRTQYIKIAFRNLAFIQGYGIEVIILPTQHLVRMAVLFGFLKLRSALMLSRTAPPLTFSDKIDCVKFITTDTTSKATKEKILKYLWCC